MTRQTMYEILGFIIKKYEEGEPANLAEIVDYYKSMEKSNLQLPENGDPIKDIFVDLSTFEKSYGPCIYSERKEDFFSTIYCPTRRGIVTYEEIRESYGLPPLEQIEV